MTRRSLQLGLLLAVLVHVTCMAQADSYDGTEEITTPALSENFYAESCPGLESAVFKIIKKEVRKDKSLTAALVRLLFHDCFVRGCDASVLLASTANSSSELEGGPNKNSLRKLYVVDKVKAKVEKLCPGVVSCADIIVLATRDSLVAIGGPAFKANLGRRDGLVSLKAEANTLPSPFTKSFETLVESFEAVGLTAKDLVVLSGAHTIGFAKCLFVISRIYDFGGVANATDPTLDPDFAEKLRAECPRDQLLTMIAMDPTGSSRKWINNTFDSNYYTNLLNNRGNFLSDTALVSTPEGRSIVEREAATPTRPFFEDFAESMEKMAAIGVLTGTQGEIRKKCTAINT